MANKSNDDKIEDFENDKMDAKALKQEQKRLKKEIKKTKGTSKGKKIFRIILVLLILTGIIFIACVYFDVGGLRTSKIPNAVENVPIVGNMVDSDSNSMSEDEMLAQISSLEQEVENLTATNENLDAQLSTALAEIDRLKEFEENQEAFREEQQNFDEMVASENPDDFTSFYEEMYPENAEEIYNELIGEEIENQEVDDYIATFTNMDAGDIAAIMEELMFTNMDLTIAILEKLDADLSGEVIAEMTPENAATIVRRMAPENIY